LQTFSAIDKLSNFATILQLMNLRATHKRLISAFLIALYAFIVTPTKWWHHHDTILTESSSSISKKEGQSPTLQNPTGINCKICSHHYSSFYQDSSIPAVTTPTFLVNISNQLCTTACKQPLSYFSGRAPPTSIIS